MDKYDYHFISLKFLTAILLGLTFAFLLIYVFTPQQREDYKVYNLQREQIKKLSQTAPFTAQNQISTAAAAERQQFESELQTRSFKLMDQAKEAVLAVVNTSYLEQLNGLREERMAVLQARKAELELREEELLQQKRNELESNLSSELQSVRQQIKEKYSNYSQEKIRDNYLKIINLKIEVEVLASDQAEKEKYEKELAELQAAQQKLLAEKNSLVDTDFSTATQKLIMEFNSQFANYREKIRAEHQSIIAAEEREIESELAEYRAQLTAELAAAREDKAAEIEQLINESRARFY